MWMILKAVALRFAVGRTLGGMLATLLFLLVPVAGVLKIVGLPILIVLGVVGAPVFLLLAAIGLPALLVVGVGAALMLLLGGLLALGLIALKIALVTMVIVWIVRRIRGRKPGLPDIHTPPDLGTTE